MLESKQILIDKILYFLMLTGTPLSILSASRYFVSGWDPLYAVHLAFIPMLALAHFCNTSYHLKAALVIVIFNVIAMGNMVTLENWGFGSGGFVISTMLCWLLYDLRFAAAIITLNMLSGFFYFFWISEMPLQVNLTITPADVIVQFLALAFYSYPLVLGLNGFRLKEAEAQAKLSDQYERLKVQEAAKTTFLKNMSHEIRTPLNATLGAIELVEKTELTEQQREYLKISETSGRSLRRVIDDILDMERIASGIVKIESSWFDSTTLLKELALIFDHSAKEVGTRIQVNIHPEVPRWLFGDVGKLHQVLTNLIANAIKFTEQGVITVTLEKHGLGSKYQFNVTDTGIGIPRDNANDVFEEFSQIDSSLSRKHEGTGLGLAICRRLLHAMGGEIDYQSREGEGTSFWFYLNLGSSDAVESPSSGDASPTAVLPAVPMPERVYRVLLAEDSDANSFILRAYLETVGHFVDRAANGIEALKLAEKSLYDAILMDVSMPEMNGLEATSILRISKGLNQETPVIALTGHVHTEIRDECVEAGMNEFVTKPVTKDQLLATLDQLLLPRGELTLP